MTDKPDKISFIQRRVWMDKFEAIPRRRDDKRLFDRLSQRQEDAYNRIEEAHGYEMAGLPQARMRYEERTDKGHDWELTPSQMDVVLDYREWIGRMNEKALQACLYAVFAYMTGATITGIEARLRIGRGKAGEYISIGLSEYCAMKKWPDDTQPRKKIRITGYAAEIESFIADEIGETGKPVKIFSKKLAQVSAVEV